MENTKAKFSFIDAGQTIFIKHAASGRHIGVKDKKTGAIKLLPDYARVLDLDELEAIVNKIDFVYNELLANRSLALAT